MLINVVVQGEVFHLWVIERPCNMSIEELRAEFPAEKAGLHVIITDSEAPVPRTQGDSA